MYGLIYSLLVSRSCFLSTFVYARTTVLLLTLNEENIHYSRGHISLGGNWKSYRIYVLLCPESKNEKI